MTYLLTAPNSAPADSADDDVRRLVTEQLAKLNAQDIDGFLEFCDPDAVFAFPGTSLLSGVHHGTEEIRRFFQMLFQLVADLHFEYRHLLVGRDRAAIEWEDSGHTFRGEPFDNRGVTVMHFRDGRLVEMRDHLDTESLAAFGSLGQRRRPAGTS
jgi:uncharacterized protein (TIGR02246 family)